MDAAVNLCGSGLLRRPVLSWGKDAALQDPLLWFRDVRVARRRVRSRREADLLCRVTGVEGDGQVQTWMRLCENGHLIEAVEALELLVHRVPHVDNSVFYGVLKRCRAERDLVVGCRVHELVVKSGYESDRFLANHLICMYASHGRLEEAMQVFTRVAAPNRYMWASIILAHARHGLPVRAIELYRRMCRSTVKPDNHIFVAVITACATAVDLCSGRKVHADILGIEKKLDIYVSNALVDMYSKCGSLDDARRVFDNLPTRDVVTWTAMIAGYAQHGRGESALALYETMQMEGIAPADGVTFVCLLQACASVGELHVGKKLHAQIQEKGLEADIVVATSLVDMYSKCRSLEDARRVFDSLPSKNVVTWTAMIAGCAQNGLGEEALALYDSMQQEGISPANAVTFVCLLQACAGIGALHQGKQLHAQIRESGFEFDVMVGCSLVNMYAKCGSLEDARRLFDNLATKDIVTWNTMIAGYCHHGLSQQALSLYVSMQLEGLTPADAVTFVCLLQACGSVSWLEKGKEIHAQISEIGLEVTDLFVASTLIDMYGKCGSMVDAQEVFDALPLRDIVTWTALIGGYARQGRSELVINLFQEMCQEGIQPNSVTFLLVLTVCNHVGLVDKGHEYFEAMIRDYGITPSLAHYTCMVDLLGRAGHVERAMEMVKTMPFQPDDILWTCVLGACQKWRNVTLGKEAFEYAAKLDENDAAPYMLMSNIYASAELWDDVHKIQATRVRSRAWKKPGQTQWTDINGTMHTFAVCDIDHPCWQLVNAGLKELLVKLKEQGYLPHLDSVLQDSTHKEQEAALYGHTAKLGRALALLKTHIGENIHSKW